MISNALSDLQGRTNSIKQGIAVTTDFFYGRRSSDALLFCMNKKTDNCYKKHCDACKDINLHA